MFPGIKSRESLGKNCVGLERGDKTQEIIPRQGCESQQGLVSVWAVHLHIASSLTHFPKGHSPILYLAQLHAIET